MSLTEAPKKVIGRYDKLPLLFAPNIGQFGRKDLYKANAPGFRCTLGADRITMTFYAAETADVTSDREMKGVVLAWRFADANQASRLEVV